MKFSAKAHQVWVRKENEEKPIRIAFENHDNTDRLLINLDLPEAIKLRGLLDSEIKRMEHEQ